MVYSDSWSQPLRTGKTGPKVGNQDFEKYDTHNDKGTISLGICHIDCISWKLIRYVSIHSSFFT